MRLNKRPVFLNPAWTQCVFALALLQCSLAQLSFWSLSVYQLAYLQQADLLTCLSYLVNIYPGLRVEIAFLWIRTFAVALPRGRLQRRGQRREQGGSSLSFSPTRLIHVANLENVLKYKNENKHLLKSQGTDITWSTYWPITFLGSKIVQINRIWKQPLPVFHSFNHTKNWWILCVVKNINNAETKSATFLSRTNYKGVFTTPTHPLLPSCLYHPVLQRKCSAPGGSGVSWPGTLYLRVWFESLHTTKNKDFFPLLTEVCWSYWLQK